MFNKIAGFLAVGLAMGAGAASAELRSAEVGLTSTGTSGDSGDIGTATLFGNVDLAFGPDFGVQAAVRSFHSEDQNSSATADGSSIVAFGYRDIGFGRLGFVLGRAEMAGIEQGANLYGVGFQVGNSGDSLHSSHLLAVIDIDDISDETAIVSSFSVVSAVSERVAITGGLDYTYVEVFGYDWDTFTYDVGVEFYATPRVQLSATLGGSYADDGFASASDAEAMLGVSYLFGNEVGPRRQRNLTAANFGL